MKGIRDRRKRKARGNAPQKNSIRGKRHKTSSSEVISRRQMPESAARTWEHSWKEGSLKNSGKKKIRERKKKRNSGRIDMPIVVSVREAAPKKQRKGLWGAGHGEMSESYQPPRAKRGHETYRGKKN